jgi:hypothetical protein
MIGTSRPSHQRFPAVFLPILLAAACGGGGGGGGSSTNPGPTIVGAAFVGSTSTPTAGDTLLLSFSEDVTMVASKLLTDADLTLSGGSSLGAVTAAPTPTGARSVTVTLGTGVSIVPGATTVALAATNDAVQDTTGQLGAGGTAVTIGTSDGAAPTLTNVTVAGIDDELNGTGPAGGTLQVPVNGWTIDLAYSDNTGIATAQTQILASVPVSTTAGSQPAGTNLRPFLTELSATNTAASYRVPTTVAYPAGTAVLTCAVVDASGLLSAISSFDLLVRPFNDAQRPFETSAHASQVWFLDFSRDLESFTTVSNGGAHSVQVVAGANGRGDCEDILHVLGLQTTTPIPNVSGNQDSNQVALAQWKAELQDQLDALYAGANVTFTLTQPSGSFGSSSSLPYANIGYSKIAVGGSSSTPGVLGIAIFDPHNGTQNDDTLPDFQGLRLGIFLHTIADAGLGSSSATAFRLTFDPLAPAPGGTPIGGDPQDGARLLGSLQDGRATDIATAITDFARFTAVVLAHECGHSMGLVQNGAMPTGLYGNDPVNFPSDPASADGHIRNTSLFPAGATNVMSPSLSYSNATNASTAFNSLNLAYLREQVFYGN